MTLKKLKVDCFRRNNTPNFAIDPMGKVFTSSMHIKQHLIENKPLWGAFSLVERLSETEIILARDPIGSRKLFYGFEVSTNTLYIKDTFTELGKKIGFDKIHSVPAGGFLRLSNQSIEHIKQPLLNSQMEFSIQKVQHFLDSILSKLSEKYKGRGVVCLSGGLDSTLVAYLAKKHFKKLRLITAVFLDHGDDSANVNLDKYHDFKNASKIAEKLKVDIEPILIKKESILPQVSNIIESCQDWRDYNVHCAALNYFLARHLSKAKEKNLGVVMTGDFMNEAFADYTSEFIDKIEYYPQMNANAKVRQRFLLRGLDSSDRELGVFSTFGIDCVQPYAFVCHLYAALELEQISDQNSKYRINGELLPNNLLEQVGKRKVRAQTGDYEGGILGFFVRKGISQNKLFEMFKAHFGCPEDFLESFIEVGRYKT